MPLQDFVLVHKYDIWGLPDWFFSPGISMRIGTAAKRLGSSRGTLNRHANALGLIVLRRQNRHRYFLTLQIELLRQGKRLDDRKVKRAVRGGENGIKALISEAA